MGGGVRTRGLRNQHPLVSFASEVGCAGQSLWGGGYLHEMVSGNFSPFLDCSFYCLG